MTARDASGIVAALRGQLLTLRDDVLAQLAAAGALHAGLIALVGNLGAALAAIDARSLDAALRHLPERGA